MRQLKSLKSLSLIFSVLLYFVSSISLATDVKPELLVKKILAKYKNSKQVDTHYERRVKSELRGIDKSEKGIIYYAQGLFVWEQQSPEQTKLINDGKTFWQVTYLKDPKSKKPKVEVSKTSVSKNKDSRSIVSLLFKDSLKTKSIKVLSNDKDSLEVQLDVSKAGLDSDTVNLKFNKADNSLKQINYKDHAENETTFNLSDTSFKNKKDEELFKFTPPKDAEVNNL